MNNEIWVLSVGIIHVHTEWLGHFISHNYFGKLLWSQYLWSHFLLFQDGYTCDHNYKAVSHLAPCSFMNVPLIFTSISSDSDWTAFSASLAYHWRNFPLMKFLAFLSSTFPLVRAVSSARCWLVGFEISKNIVVHDRKRLSTVEHM